MKHLGIVFTLALFSLTSHANCLKISGEYERCRVINAYSADWLSGDELPSRFMLTGSLGGMKQLILEDVAGLSKTIIIDGENYCTAQEYKYSYKDLSNTEVTEVLSKDQFGLLIKSFVGGKAEFEARCRQSF